MEKIDDVFNIQIKNAQEFGLLIKEKISLKNFLRIKYIEGINIITTNSIFLTYSQAELNSTFIDLIYMRAILNYGEEITYELVRSECEVRYDNNDLTIQKEKKIFCISVKSISKIIENLSLLSHNNFTLTNLRKIISNKKSKKDCAFVVENNCGVKLKYSLQLIINMSNIILIQKEETMY